MSFFFKQKTAYEMRISDWSSDVCSSAVEKVEHTQYGEHPAQNEDQAKSPRSAQGEGIPHVSLTIHHLAPPRPQRDLSPDDEEQAYRNEDAGDEERNEGKHDTIPSTDRKSTRLNSRH